MYTLTVHLLCFENEKNDRHHLLDAKPAKKSWKFWKKGAADIAKERRLRANDQEYNKQFKYAVSCNNLYNFF